MLVRRLLLVGSDLRAVVLNLCSSGDEGDQETEPLPERGDIVADLEEQVVLYFLGEADAGCHSAHSCESNIVHDRYLQNVALDVGGVQGRESGGHR